MFLFPNFVPNLSAHRFLNARIHGERYGRGGGVGRTLGVGASLGVGEGLGVKVGVAVGVAVGVGVGVGDGATQCVRVYVCDTFREGKPGGQMQKSSVYTPRLLSPWTPDTHLRSARNRELTSVPMSTSNR